MNTKKIAITAVSAALIFVITWMIRIPIPLPIAGAYVNVGDSVIYGTALIIGGLPAALAAAVGSILADMMAGVWVYALPTFIIKGLMGLVCAKICVEPKFSRFALACLVGGAIMVSGYAIFEFFAFGKAYMLTSIGFNCLQWAGSLMIALALYKAFMRVRKIYRGEGKKEEA
ncbi:MAG: ECF transporter S component [Clostridia bacterium]|nr:ECF transporter S component [Clostridia bacterium]